MWSVLPLLPLLLHIAPSQTRTPKLVSTEECQLKLLCSILKDEGYLHLDCEEVSPRCEISITELLEEELTDDSQRARRSVFGLPPLITTAGEKPQCKLCEKKGTLCFLFGLGSFKGCAGASLLEPYLGPLCNAAALPVRLACKANSIKCYKQGCGLIRIPNIKLPIPLP